MGYVFYFDESFHDRKIKLNDNGILNTMSNNSLDSYIGVFCGFDSDSEGSVIREITSFEEKYKIRFGLSDNQELKSTTIGKKNFKYGIATFNKDTFDFYNDFFDMINRNNPILQIEIISKVEHLLLTIFSDIIFDRSLGVNESVFYYTLTKFILVYHTPELLKCLFNVTSTKDRYNLRKQLLRTLQTIIPLIKNISRKKKEYVAFRQLYIVLRDSKLYVTSSDKLNFSYYPNFSGLSLLLSERNIPLSEVDIIIDNEEKTYDAALQFKFKSIHQADSKDIIQLHICDIISGFIGRMIYALCNDASMAEDPLSSIEDIKYADLTSKRIQDQRWFEISEKQYNLYILIYKAIIVNNEHYWTTMTLNYCDQALCFFALLRYISSYKSYDNFSDVTSAMHAEYFNSWCLHELDKHYNKLEGRM